MPIQDPGTTFGRNVTYGLLDNVGRMIVTGAYDDRPFPTEAELSQEHKVSRSVTREAIKMLTAKGLLTARPRKGTTIQPVSHWNLFDPDVLRWMLERKFTLELLSQFNELRAVIEPAACELAARNGNEEELAAVEAGYRRMVAAEAGEDDGLEADIAFHVAILEASGNPFFAQFKDLVATALRTSIRFTNRIVGRTVDLAAHGAVLDAILAHDGDRAKTAMAAIIDEVTSLILTSDAAS